MYTCMCVDRTSVFPQGVRGKAVQEEADRMIEDLKLLDKRNTPSRALTGGMKRKLRYVHVTYVLHEPGTFELHVRTYMCMYFKAVLHSQWCNIITLRSTCMYFTTRPLLFC